MWILVPDPTSGEQQSLEEGWWPDSDLPNDFAFVLSCLRNTGTQAWEQGWSTEGRRGRGERSCLICVPCALSVRCCLGAVGTNACRGFGKYTDLVSQPS